MPRDDTLPAGEEPAHRPALLDGWREGYGAAALRDDALAGLTVAIVALPLSMAIAVACGVGPERGLHAAVVGGFLVSLLGGSRHQIGGPAGAFIVLVAASVAEHGIEGTVLATFLSGALLLLAGALHLGSLIRLVPHPVTVGFTAGIAAIILASQLRELLGLPLEGPEPGPILPKLAALWSALPGLNPAALAVSAATVLLVLAVRRARPRWPALLIGVVGATLLAAALSLPVETIGSRFGGLPAGLPAPRLPGLSPAAILAVLPTALAFALLGGIESLLSATVADRMSGERHRPEAELLAQGAANLGTALFGALPVTGTIARTATNLRSGARTPVAGMLHAAFLLLALLVAAPLASPVPLAALAGVLAVVAWGMAERHAIGGVLRSGRGEAAVLLATLLVVLLRDLLSGILVGTALAGLLALRRLAATIEVTSGPAEDAEGRPVPGVAVVRVSGAFFFGASGTVSRALARLDARPRAWVLDLSGVSALDSTAAAALEGFARRAAREGARLYVAGAARPVRRALLVQGVRARFRSGVAAAVRSAGTA